MSCPVANKRPTLVWLLPKKTSTALQLSVFQRGQASSWGAQWSKIRIFPHFYLTELKLSSGKAFKAALLAQFGLSFFPSDLGPELWGNGSSARIARHNQGLPRWANWANYCFEANGSFSGSQNCVFADNLRQEIWLLSIVVCISHHLLETLNTA